MYKTIKHGDNSLQYTILPQEEGIANVKSKKPRNKGKTAAILTITVILICGIIATAVIVPLLLTSDLVVLPAAFQKFSVSSLRKSHSGNHVVVLAKKPYGWTNHHNPVHSPGNNKTYVNNNNKAYKQQEETLNSLVNSTTTAATTQTTKIVEPTTEKPTTVMSNEIEANKGEDDKGAMEKNVLRVYEKNRYTEVPVERNYLDISTTTRSSKGNEFLEGKVVRISNTEIQTTSSTWYHKQWSFGHTYMRWMGNDIADNFKIFAGGSVLVILCVIIFAVCIRRNRRNKAVKKSTDSKADDKDTLLKESTAGSEEE